MGVLWIGEGSYGVQCQEYCCFGVGTVFILVLFLLGLVIGPISTFFGIGGGFLIISVLYWLYPDLSPQVVISTSLGVICLNSMVNIRNFRKLQMVPEWNLALSIAMTMAVGCLLGSQMSAWFSIESIKLVIASLLIINSVTTFFAESQMAPWVNIRTNPWSSPSLFA